MYVTHMPHTHNSGSHTAMRAVCISSLGNGTMGHFFYPFGIFDALPIFFLHRELMSLKT